MGAGTRWTDADKHLLRRLVASGIGLKATAAKMDRSEGSVATAADRYGAVWPKKPKMARPDDFAERWAEMSLKTLAAHYGTSSHATEKWARELGLSRPSSLQVTRKPKVEQPKVSRVTSSDMGRVRATGIINAPIRDMSTEGRAADYLRRYGPVFRREDYWMRGTTRLTGAELIQRAQSKGWVL